VAGQPKKNAKDIYGGKSLWCQGREKMDKQRMQYERREGRRGRGGVGVVGKSLIVSLPRLPGEGQGRGRQASL